MNRIDRNKTLVRHILNCGIASSQKDLGVKLGYANESSFSQIINEKVPYPKNFIERITAIVPDLNTDWLLYGEGEMLITDTAPRIEDVSIVHANDTVDVDIEALMKEQGVTMSQLAAIVNESIDYISSCGGKLHSHHILLLQGRFGDDVVDRYTKYSNVMEAEIIESFPVLPEAVIAEPNTNIEEVIEEDGSELEAISPNLLLSNMKVNVAEQIKETSMLPTFQPNDWVFIRFLKDKMKIVSGKTYYLNCKNRPTMIRRVKFEGEDKLRLIAKNSQYDDIIICRSDIINIGNVVALFRMTFGDQYSELEALRRQKDDQLEERHQQINNFIDIQREMIAEIRESGKRNERERERTDKLIEKIINNA